MNPGLQCCEQLENHISLTLTCLLKLRRVHPKISLSRQLFGGSVPNMGHNRLLLLYLFPLSWTVQFKPREPAIWNLLHERFSSYSENTISRKENNHSFQKQVSDVQPGRFLEDFKFPDDLENLGDCTIPEINNPDFNICPHMCTYIHVKIPIVAKLVSPNNNDINSPILVLPSKVLHFLIQRPLFADRTLFT